MRRILSGLLAALLLVATAGAQPTLPTPSPLPAALGGTGATSAAGALGNLGAFPARAMRAGTFEVAAGLSNTTTGAVGGGRLNANPIDILAPATLDRIAVYLAVTAPSALQVRLGLYADSGGQPGAMLVDAGTVSVASGTAAGSVLATISYQVTSPRRLWAAVLTDTTTTWATAYGYALDLPTSVPAGASGWQSQGWWVNSVTYGALPAAPTWVRNDQSSNAPVVSVRIGSLP